MMKRTILMAFIAGLTVSCGPVDMFKGARVHLSINGGAFEEIISEKEIKFSDYTSRGEERYVLDLGDDLELGWPSVEPGLYGTGGAGNIKAERKDWVNFNGVDYSMGRCDYDHGTIEISSHEYGLVEGAFYAELCRFSLAEGPEYYEIVGTFVASISDSLW